ncbi:MAG: hypothetical protein R2762_01090 [Bryobacteraceae bacterium]
MRLAIAVLTYAGVCLLAAPRPMTFLDVVEMRTASKPAVSPDGKWAVYSLLTPDWKQGRSFSDLYLAPMAEGVAAARRMTFTKGKNETGAQWSRDSSYFVFTSNREAPATAATEQQLYAMRPDGGEAQRIGSHKEGVGAFAFSPDGKWLVYVAGKKTERQIWVLPAAEVGTAEPKPLTKHATPVTAFLFSRDGKQIYFTAPETAEKASFERIEKKFTAKIRNEDTPLDHLWVLDVESRTERRLTGGAEYTVSSLVVSPDSKWLGFRGTPKDRYRRAVTEAATYADLYLLDTATGTIERLTNNKDIRESSMSFSPDSATVAFVAADDFTYFRNEKVYVRPVKGWGVGARSGVTIGPWALTSGRTTAGTIYFNGGKGATQYCSAHPWSPAPGASSDQPFPV